MCAHVVAQAANLKYIADDACLSDILFLQEEIYGICEQDSSESPILTTRRIDSFNSEKAGTTLLESDRKTTRCKQADGEGQWYKVKHSDSPRLAAPGVWFE